MTDSSVPQNRRILIVDDNRSIHDDFLKILVRPAATAEQDSIEALSAELFGTPAAASRSALPDFSLDSAYQGPEALERVSRAVAENRPYAMAFVDMRMPPGWDGVETTLKLWEADPHLQVVICTAYSDYSWEEMLTRFGGSERLLVLKKPFDPIEALQLANSLTQKWHLARCAERHTQSLEARVQQRTAELSRALAESRRMEQALQESRDFSDALLNGLPGIFYHFDESGRFLRWNRNFERVTGYDAGELAALRASDFFAEDEKQLVASGIAEIYEKGQAQIEADFLLKDGRRIPHLFTGMCFEQHGRKGFIGVALDISWRKDVEQKLRQERDFSETVLNSLPGIFYHYDENLRFLRWNKNHERVTGYSGEELAVMHPLDFFPEEEKAQVANAMTEVFTKGDGQVEANFRLKDGRRIPYLFTGVRFEHDGRQGFVGVGSDIEARTRMEEALREKTAILEAKIESSIDGILVVDRNGKKVVHNRRLTELWKIPPEIAIAPDGTPRPEAAAEKTTSPADYLARVAWLIEHPAEIGRDVIELVDGTIMDRYSAPVLDKEGRYYGRVWIHRDITEGKRLEAGLIAAKEAAESASRLKSEFLANMSHEVRTPLNGVIGMTDLLLMSELAEEQRHFAQAVRDSGESLLALVNDILDFSKIEAGKLRLEIIGFNLQETVDSVMRLLATQAHAKGLELLTFIKPDVPGCLRGDPGRLRQIISNLVGNAVKFTSEGEVALTISIAAETDGGTRLRFEVRDTGIGISPEVQSRLFKSFTQADGSTTRKYGGTGLGLAISKQLVMLMNGEIGAESALGRGSTFWFEAEFGRQTGSAEPAMPVALAGRRVLLVDDNTTNLKILRHYMQAWNLRSTSVSSGAEALDVLRQSQEPFDLAILDMQMPEMDGLMLAQAIGQEPRGAATRMIMLTSLGQDLVDAEWKAAGIAACLLKPVQKALLLNRIIEVMTDPAETQVRAPAEGGKLHAFSPAPATEGEAHRILLVEDNRINRMVVLNMLKKLGYQADVAVNGLEAVSAVEKTPYDLVLMDCQMPEMDGYEATRRIRSSPCPQPRIVAVTANTVKGDEELCRAAGADDYMGKPLRIEKLREMIERWLPRAAA